MQQVVQPTSASNGYTHRKAEREVPNRFENKVQAEKINSGRIDFDRSDVHESPSRDRVAFVTACLVGQQVEIQLLDGSVYAGIFHAIHTDKGIVLKMAYQVKDVVQKNSVDFARKPLVKTFIVPSGDLVQVVAKGVSLTREAPMNELLREKQQELMTDSSISQTRIIEVGRELEPWIPDENDPRLPELDNTFDCSWNRGWDQFEANETLFGVKSTFDEELYTTKLEKGPQMLELERVAERLAREIEGEDTRDLHLAEERGLQINGSLDIDEETLYSSVYRGVDDSGCDEIEDKTFDTKNDETFSKHNEAHHDPVIDKHLLDGNLSKNVHRAQNPSRLSSLGEAKSALSELDETSCRLGSGSCIQQLQPEQPLKHSFSEYTRRAHVHQVIERPKCISNKDDNVKHLVDDPSDALKADESDPSNTSSIVQEKESRCNEVVGSSAPLRTQGTTSPLARPSSSASSTSDRAGTASTSAAQGLSSSSSVSSLTSEKSALNPHAKEFKLNPNAKSFVPSRAPLRPSSPIADSPFYYSPNVAATAQIHGMSVGIGMGPSYAIPQHVMFNSQAGALPQPYYGPQFGQQMMVGQQRPVFYMPTYPSEMPGSRAGNSNPNW